MTDNLICIAKITKPHGIKGQAKLMSYAQIPKDIFTYPCLYDEQMNQYIIKLVAQHDNLFVVSFNQNTSRNLVEELAGTKLYVTKEMLKPAAENEYYNNDLEGLEVLDSDGKLCGHILEIHNFGAGDIIEMKILDKKDSVFLPFNEEYIKEVNLAKRYLVFDFISAGI